MAENDVLFRENEELVEERLRFSKQKTSFSCEETPTFWRKSDFWDTGSNILGGKHPETRKKPLKPHDFTFLHRN